MIVASIVFFVSMVLTWLVRMVARSQYMLDIPNERSSHTVPTPHGGGVSIVVTFFGVMIWLFLDGQVNEDIFWALTCALPIAGISLLDDIHPLPAKIRLLIQVLCAITALWIMNGVDEVALGVFVLHGTWLNLLALFIIVWLTNLFNFIDGIDGYAGGQTVFVGLAAWCLFGNDIAGFLAAAAAGFLVFNWHRASIFMGDVGSATLGFIWAILMLNDATEPAFLGWMVLLALFWFDATLTLIRRYRNNELLTQAHKKHAYQRLHQSGYSHDTVVIFGMGINLLFFGMLYIVEPNHFWMVFLMALALLYGVVKYVDQRKPFS
jgi:UDP-N-acetylmuramyl pentapeptide phosphotransferase/UDP-N-acetylglucosamine-1-phosphate transferase